MEQRALPYEFSVKNFVVDGLQYAVALTPELYNDVELTDISETEAEIVGYDSGLSITGAFQVILIGENFRTMSFRVSNEFDAKTSQMVPRGVMVEILKMMKEIFDIEDTIVLYEPFDKPLYDFLKYKGVSYFQSELEEREDSDMKHLPAEFILTCYTGQRENGSNEDYISIDSDQIMDMVEGIKGMVFYIALRPENYIAYCKHLLLIKDLDL